MITTILSFNTSHSRQQHANRLHADSNLYLPGVFQWLSKLLLFGIVSALLCNNSNAMNIALSDHDQAKKLLDDGILQPLESILELYAEQYPGPVRDIKMETQNKLIFYKIDIVDKDGTVQTLTINAQSGHLIQSGQPAPSRPLMLAKKRGQKNVRPLSIENNGNQIN